MRTAAWMGLIVTVLGLTLLGGATAAAKPRPKDSDKPIVKGALGRKLDAAVSKAAPDIWGSVLVAREGEILLAKGYGFADYRAAPNTPRTIHELASASKQVAAAAILHLQQKRRLEVTDTLDKFFKGLPADKKEVQLHHLLTHTSGLNSKLGVPYASGIGRKTYVKQMLTPPLAEKPGEKFQYSNVGYALLAAVVEVVSKKGFEEYVEKHLFGPAGCEDTGFINDRDLTKTKRASVRQTKEPGEWTAASWHWGWGYRGMGGVVTTVLDLLRWDRALRTDDILDAKSKEMLYKPFKGGYAYGWKVEYTDRGTRKAHHSGGVAGYAINVVRYLEDDVCVFVLSNDGKAAFDATRALEALLFEPVQLKVAIDVKPYDVPGSRILKLPAQLTWKAQKKGRDLVLQLRDKKHVVFEVRAPKALANKLVASLEQAIATREPDDDGKPAAFEAGLYMQRYGGGSKIKLTEQLTMDVQPEYRSGDVVDERVMFRVIDAKHGVWPIMAKMNVAAARQMLETLRKTL